MRLAPTLTAVAVSAVLLGLSMELAAAGKVDVSYTHPEKFRDASLRSAGYERGADAFVMKELSAHLQTLGDRYLAAGQTLHIDILDIDLAGRYEPWHSYAYDVRFMRDITWPSIKLHYELKQDGKTLANQEQRVNDMFYLQRPGRSVHSSDRLYAEKAMLDDWFRERFGEQRVSATH
ncbi:DUF3016 domain-containing protein [Pseudomonas sp. UL073]|uniref:DUF3016 domain-containing protein n=1 Tax=Zestomonas insulae TaxID=2809017 RepID=A0ABS2IH72_9GAMM|nr:DUF3016 domain-containing protein [Pseudomonas insulae]MBM7062085.1 DUF3016 domain-containing protein [Pseudomonas insulae]